MADSGPGARALHSALAALQQGQMPQAQHAGLAALEAFTAAGDTTGAAAAHQVLAMVAGSRGDFAAAITHVDAAIPFRAATGDREGLASLWQERYELCLRGGDLPGARHSMERQLQVQRDAGDREGAAHAQHQLAQLCLQTGEVAQAEEYVQEALFAMQGTEGNRARSALQLLYANIWVVKGDPDRALRHALEGLELARKARFRPGEIDAFQELGTLHAARGEWEAARRALQEALNGRELLKDVEGRAHVLRELAGVEFQAGNVDLAFEHLDYAVRSVREVGNFVGEVTLLQLLAASADEHERPERALRAAEALCDAALRAGDKESEAAALVALGNRRATQGDLPGARDAFDRANRLQQEAGLLEEAAVSQGMLGQVLYVLGDQAEGRRHLESSHATLVRLGSDTADTMAELLAELDGEA